MSTDERRKRAVLLYNSHIYGRQDISQDLMRLHRTAFALDRASTNCFLYAII